MKSKQLSFNFFSPTEERPDSSSKSIAEEKLSQETKKIAQGAIYTRAEVVDFILDLVNYETNHPLHKKRILEPSFGEGNFLFPLVKRLLTAWRQTNSRNDIVKELGNIVRAVELDQETYWATYHVLLVFLQKEGVEENAAKSLLDCWLIHGDFLLTPLEGKFDFVVGNPPYVRQELIEDSLLEEYRKQYQSLYDRADLYIPFIERSLSLLAKGGHLGFICADRWMKNRYGGPLRKMIAEKFYLKIYVDMFDTLAFDSKVTVYPAITIISKEPSGCTRKVAPPALNRNKLSNLAITLKKKSLPQQLTNKIHELSHIANGSDPWLLESSDQLALIRRLEKQLPYLEEAGCKVGIGVATGADKVFIKDYHNLDVEPTRKLPLVTTKDIGSGKVEWRGQAVINPFADNGQLVDLNDYPKLQKYLEDHKEVISSRHCARKNPSKWYRTIDRIVPGLCSREKLLIPDIKEKAHVVYEQGEFYPHHNLYYILSYQWDLRALQAVMLSSLTRLFIATYSTKIRGGFLRFQAQYLRRLRLPYWVDVPNCLRKQLVQAAINLDLPACDRAVFKLYGLSKEEQATLGEDNNNGS